jgi:hypothetical protein
MLAVVNGPPGWSWEEQEDMRSWTIHGAAAIVAGLASVGCATHTGTGALAGGGLGAATGAIIGSATGDAGTGALLGAGLGAAAGGLVGSGQDQIEQRNRERWAAANTVPAPGPMSVGDVVQMTRSGVRDETIVATIRSNQAVFHLTAADVTDLHNQGVTDRVIQAMVESGRRPVVVRPRPVVYEAAPVYVVEPPPRVSVGFGYHYGRPRHCW